jgi:hypothetical protein
MRVASRRAGLKKNVTPDNNANNPINGPTGKALAPAACLCQCMFVTIIIELIHMQGRLQFCSTDPFFEERTISGLHLVCISRERRSAIC